MQTFLPYPDLRVSCQVLDDRRLGKQRVETYQILRALTWPQYAWKNHPAVRMWRGFVPALVVYGMESCREWVRRGYRDSVATELLAWTGGQEPVDPELPPWFGLHALHLSHRSALLRKDPAHYRPLFDALGNPDEPDDLPYLWPPDVFPRWPVHGGTDGVALQDALRLLGYAEPRPGQAEAVEAVAAGRDALLVARPGTGGSAAGLLAGLVVPGRTLWVTPWEGEVCRQVPVVPPPVPREQVTTDRPPPVARPPQPEDLAAMAAEDAPPEFLFAHPDDLVPREGVRLLVVDRAQAFDDDDGRAVAAVREQLPGVPVLAVAGRADAQQQAALTTRLGLVDPLRAGGGWDPVGTWLGVVAWTTPAARRRALADLARRAKPALVVTASRERADRTVTALAADGLRAAVWAPPPMRASRAAAAVADWRSRRLDALVVPGAELPPLGRIRPGVLVGDGVDDPERWHALVDAVAAPAAVLLTARPVTDGCRRAALLAPFGEPVEVPCGRCDWCRRSDGPLPAAAAVRAVAR